ncbi:IS30 family transposase [Micromonospora zamorensis]|uniref:IS30 family transposase n=1 Tax=Micromonospora zamorensis TaxID=709883 RepID=UPI003D8F2D68
MVGRRSLTVADREEITRGIAEGLSGQQIAAVIGRDPSVVSREISRGGGRGFYRAWRSQRQAQRARRRPKPRKLELDARLRKVVVALLGEGWSPDQVAGRLRVDYPDDEAMRVSHEAIYTWMYALPVGELARQHLRLRSGRRNRRPTRSAASRAPKIPNPTFIDQRPVQAEDRRIPGHWEGDLVIGKNGASATATLVERTSRFLILIPLSGRDSPTVTSAVATGIAGLPDALRRTLTWDCGTEMAEHAALSIAADIDVYFAHPHSPWERGTNESTNRWIREYLPRGTVIPNDHDHLNAIADRLNNRPRRILGYKKPKEVFAELLTSQIASTS